MRQFALLAIETSTESCSVALLIAATARSSGGARGSGETPGDGASAGRSGGAPRPGPPITRPDFSDFVSLHRDAPGGAAASCHALPTVRALLREARLALTDCAALAFGAGPGSFTGLRTAAGVVQGLAFGASLPVIPVSTLMACAEAARMRDPGAKRVLAALDARMGEVYWADFEWRHATGDWHALRAAALADPGDVPVPAAPYVLAGNAAAVLGDILATAPACRAVVAVQPHAVAVARIGWRAWRAGRVLDASQAAPHYVRDRVAQTTDERRAARDLAKRA